MDIVVEISASLGHEWIPNIYKEKVRSQRTRAYHLDIASRVAPVALFTFVTAASLTTAPV